MSPKNWGSLSHCVLVLLGYSIGVMSADHALPIASISETNFRLHGSFFAIRGDVFTCAHQGSGISCKPTYKRWPNWNYKLLTGAVFKVTRRYQGSISPILSLISSSKRGSCQRFRHYPISETVFPPVDYALKESLHSIVESPFTLMVSSAVYVMRKLFNAGLEASTRRRLLCRQCNEY